MKLLIQGMVVSSAIALVSLAPIGHAMAQTAPQVMYKDIVRPNGQKRSEAVYQADVNTCYQQTGGNPYVPDSAAMKKCMLTYGFQFMWQKGFGNGSGGTVASSSGSSDDDWVQQTLDNNHQAEQQQEEQNTWALQQNMIQQEQQSADMASEQASEMAASMAADAAQNALAQDMANQAMMNNQ